MTFAIDKTNKYDLLIENMQIVTWRKLNLSFLYDEKMVENCMISMLQK